MEYIRFETPLYIVIGIFLVIAVLLYRKRNSQATQITTLRIVIMCLIVLGLSEPQILIRIGNECVLFVVDVSKSVIMNIKDMNDIKEYIFSKEQEKERDDRIGVIEFAERVNILVPPSDIPGGKPLADVLHLMASDTVDSRFTNIEDAMHVASKVFPEGYRKKIVLITDGNENTGRVSSLYDAFKSLHITVDVLPVGGVKHDEVLIESLRVPAAVRAGNPFSLEVAVGSNTETVGELQILVDGQKIQTAAESFRIVPADHQLHRIPITLEEGGFHDIAVNLFAGKDGVSVNNSAMADCFVESRPRILVVAEQAGEKFGGMGQYLVTYLIKNQIDAGFLPGKQLPDSVEGYDRYDAVVLNDVPSRLLLPEQMRALNSAVHDLGIGLVMISGVHSIAPQGFSGTPIESALPVMLSPSSGKRPSSINLVFVVDKSGSMSEGEQTAKIQLAIDSMQSLIEMFGEEDQVGIIMFDSQPHIVASPGTIKNREEIIKTIQKIAAQGSTDIHPALVQAYEWLKNSEAAYNHIILLSDGKTRERDFNELIRSIREKNITITVIGIGRDSNITLLKEIAHKGNGRYFEVEDDLHELSQIFRLDTMMATNTLYVEETFSPRLKDPDPIVNGIPVIMPAIRGYMVTTPRNSAIIPVISHKGDPIVAFWRYGLGKAAIFTGDDGSRWSGQWILWEGFGRLWVQLVRRTIRSEAATGSRLSFDVRGNRAEVHYELPEEAGKMRMKIDARLLSPDGTPSDVALLQSSGGRYHAVIDGLNPGKYMMITGNEESGDVTGITRRSFVINDANEFFTLRQNDALLADITSHTGGKILTPEDPLFQDDRNGVRQFMPLWPYIFSFAVVLFLVDVAAFRGISLFRNKRRSA